MNVARPVYRQPLSDCSISFQWAAVPGAGTLREPPSVRCPMVTGKKPAWAI